MSDYFGNQFVSVKNNNLFHYDNHDYRLQLVVFFNPVTIVTLNKLFVCLSTILFLNCERFNF